MDDSLNPWRRQELVWSLRWLAAEPEAALSAVPHVATPDEIALDIADGLQDARDWKIVEDSVLALIEKIDREFAAMGRPGTEALWSDEALRTSPEWEAQRERARAVLAAMGEERSDAQLAKPRAGRTYVRGRARSDPTG